MSNQNHGGSIMISIIIPVYNSTEFILYALKSILNQDYNFKEIIIVNDGSDAPITDYINDLGSLDERIIIVNNEANIGLGLSLKKAFERSSGKFSLILHHDDLLPSNYLSIMIKQLDDDVVIAFSNYELIDRYGDKISNNSLSHKLKFIFPRLYLTHSSISTVGIIVNTELANKLNIFQSQSYEIRGENKSIKTYDEWRTWVELSKYGKIRYNSKVLTQYRQHGDNMRDHMYAIGNFSHTKREIVTKRIARSIIRSRYGNVFGFLLLFIYTITIVIGKLLNRVIIH